MGTTITIKVADKTYKLGQGVGDFVGELKKILEDGFQPGDDIGPIVNAATKYLIPVIGGVGDISGEYQGDKEEFLNAFLLGVSGIAKHYLK